MNVTLTVCAYNAESRLPVVMDSIARQIVDEAIAWEVVIVDNNSADRTADVARSFADRIPVPLKVVTETKQGLAYARRAAFQASSGAIISFLDDDTAADPHWVQTMFEFFRDHSGAGLVGPQIRGAFELPPPTYFELIKGALAITNMGDVAVNLTKDPRHHPLFPHAGCRRDAISAHFGRDSYAITGRRGNELSSCEDTVLAFEVKRLGWQWWYEPKLKLTHYIPASRLNEEYLEQLFFGLGRSAALVDVAVKGRRLRVDEIAIGVFHNTIRYLYYSMMACSPLKPGIEPFVCRLYAQNRLAGVCSYARYAINGTAVPEISGG